MLQHLRNGWQVDQAILSEEDKVVVIRFGHDWDPSCMVFNFFTFFNIQLLLLKYHIFKCPLDDLIFNSFDPSQNFYFELTSSQPQITTQYRHVFIIRLWMKPFTK